MTFNTYFNEGTIPLDKFLYNASKNSKYTSLTVRELIKNPPENLSVQRLKAKTIKEAYPPDDSPRGDADGLSVKYHQRSKNVSPVFIVKFKGRLIFLDGMHRCVAAILNGKRKIYIFEVDLDV